MKKILLTIACLLLTSPLWAQGQFAGGGSSSSSSSGACTFGANGNINCTATGTNQNITLTPSGTAPVNVGQFVVLNLGCDGTTDMTSAIQAAVTANPAIFIPAQTGGACIISTPISTPSNRYIKVSPQTTIKLKDSATLAAGAVTLLVNADISAGDSNITIDGGNWDGNAANNPNPGSGGGYIGGVSVRFQHVTNLVLENMTYTNPISYNTQIIQVSYCSFLNNHFVTTTVTANQGGFYLMGPSDHIYVQGITGYTPDDLVSIASDDTATNDPVFGNVSDVVVDGVLGESGANLVRINGRTHNIANVSVSNVSSSFSSANNAVTISNTYGGGAATGTINDISISNVSNLSGTFNVGPCNTINALDIKNYHGTELIVNGSCAIGRLGVNGLRVAGGSTMVYDAGTIKSLNIENANSYTTGNLFKVISGGTVTFLSILDANITPCTGLINILSGGTVTNASITNSSCDVTAAPTSPLVTNAGTLSSLRLAGINYIGASVAPIANTGTLTRVFWDDPAPQIFSGFAACSSTYEGNRWSVTDSTLSTWGTTITGGGANHVLGYCDGTNWTVAAQ